MPGMMMMMMIVQQSVDWMIGSGNELLRKNLPQCRSVHHKSHLLRVRTRAAAVESR
jgi:hypothetical protein